jgi:hypothetical protein
MRSPGIITNKKFVIAALGFAALISLGSYLLASNWIFRIGFPLDDAWIHQTYARNYALNGTWAFLPNQPSAGSTAPGWSFLLAFGYWLNLGPFVWTFLLGWLLLWGLSMVAAFGFKILLPERSEYAIWVGLLLLFEWHLTWAAGSGMETILTGLLALVVLVWVIKIENRTNGVLDTDWWQWLCIGGLIGLSVWIRPGGFTLLGVTGFFLILSDFELKEKIKAFILVIVGLMIVVLPYLYFNQILAGDVWPNTFFAKQAEYEELRNSPFWQRIINLSRQPVTGVGIALLPGILWFSWNSIVERKWARLAGVIWIFGYLGIYAWRLPVVYQHGRYVMPIIPAFCLFGFAGMVQLISAKFSKSRWRIVRRSWILSTAFVLLVFWILGGNAFAQDVAVIESEMVETAKWVADNTAQESLIAAHDIGALGYFSGRDLLDLAGLISPEVIPFIRDENALEYHINERGADFLMTFPGWYPNLTNDLVLIYKTDGQFSPEMGGENMAVFEWKGNNY